MANDVDFQDWRAISELKARYCRFLDTKRWDDWGMLFVEDYRMDVSDRSNIAPIIGRQAVVDFVIAQLAGAETAHHAHSPEIVVEGDEATAVWAMQDRVVYGRSGMSITGYGHYHEKLVRSDGCWQIAELRLTRLRVEMESQARSKAV